MKLLRPLKENQMVQFSLISLVVIAIVAVIFAVSISNSIRAHALDALAEEAIGDSSGRLMSVLTPADLETPMTGERYDRFNKFVQESIVSERTARVKLWARDGTVIYSNDQAIVGKKFPNNKHLPTALGGEIATEIKILNDPENERESFLGTLMEVYAPIRFPDSTVPQGAFEIYQYYKPTADLIADLRSRTFLFTGMMALLLYGASIGMSWKGWSAIVREKKGRRQAEDDKEKMELQLRESQKMEAVGRLAGGIAHDFNNLLTVITVASEMLLNDFSKDDPKRQDIEEIRKATDRATSLTRQLLTFSRRQVLELRVLDINALIVNMDKMLRRLISEDIKLEIVFEPGNRSVKADGVNIEQVIMNMVVNAIDAMPKGGKITIKTDHVVLSKEDCAAIPEARPGGFVRISITDTGIGMPKEIREHIFEPFFTTKAKGKGTGLGLSTVYGIVTQFGGWLNVYSEPGRGTTFRIYFPAFVSGPEDLKGLTKESLSSQGLNGAGERILLVEDDPAIRAVARRLLTENGYQVFAAESAEEALDIFEKEGNFQLVVSDVVLPGKSGVELATQIRARKPDQHIILASGYADTKAQLSTIQDEGYLLIQKPYTTDKLLRSIKENIARTKEANEEQS